MPRPSSTFALDIFPRTLPCVAVKPLMAPQTFHYFSTLPKADRELIWALAIRPKRPSAHVFTLYMDVDDTEPSLLSQYWLHDSGFTTNLAAPQVPTSDDDNQERQFSWVKDNCSTYLIDYGLWAACRESRAAMEKRFKVTEAPVTSYFFSGDEWQRCLTYPETDLFLLHPLDPGTLVWECTYGFPFHNRSESSEREAIHIALNYDLREDCWCDGPGTKCVTEAVVHGLLYADQLWFVDYSLRRRANIPLPRDRRRFHGNGCIFTEVWDGDMSWYHD